MLAVSSPPEIIETVVQEGTAVAAGDDGSGTVEPEIGETVVECAPPSVQEADRTLTKEPPKEFFHRTSEILSGRRAEPAEVQTILLSEIQEWIAAGPAPEADPLTREIVLDREPEQMFENAEADEPEPGVIRIGDPPRQRATEAGPPEAAGIEEHSFELSIGAINVTIEGDAPPQTVTISKPGPAEQRSAERPGVSRLSRHYI